MKRCAKPRRAVLKLERSGAKLPPLQITGPQDAVQALTELIGDRAYEVFVAVYLNARNCVIGYEEFTSGEPQGVTVAPAAIIRDAFLATAIGIITAHQHPSGDPEPSTHDQTLWKKLREQADVMDIQVLDNFILTPTAYYSEAEKRVVTL